MIPFVLAATLLFLNNTQAATEQSSHSFHLVNAGPHVIRAVYVSPSRDASWGQNRLQGSGGLSPKASADIAFEGACGTFDIRLVADKGVEFLFEEQEFCGDGAVLTVRTRSLTRSPLR